MATRKRRLPWEYADWTRFMPQNAPLAEFGGMHYQVPGGLLNYGAPYSTPYGVLLGGDSSGATDAPPVTYTPPAGVGSTDSGGNTVTDSSGAEWVMSPDGQWYPADSDYGEGLLGTGRLHGDPNFYDSSGNYVGSEGEGARQNVEWGGGEFSQNEWDTGVLDVVADEDLPPGVTQDAQGNRYRTHNVLGEELDNPISMGNRLQGLTVARRFTGAMSGLKNTLTGANKTISDANAVVDKTKTAVDELGPYDISMMANPSYSQAGLLATDPYDQRMLNAGYAMPLGTYDVLSPGEDALSGGATYEQRMAGIRNAQMVDARTRAEQAALSAQYGPTEDSRIAADEVRNAQKQAAIREILSNREDERVRQLRTMEMMGPNYGDARLRGLKNIFSPNDVINAAMVPQQSLALARQYDDSMLSLGLLGTQPVAFATPQTAMPAVGNVPAGPTTAAAAALARLSQPQDIQWAAMPQAQAAIRAATIARQRETETEGRDAGTRGQQGSGMAGPGGGPGGW